MPKRTASEDMSQATQRPRRKHIYDPNQDEQEVAEIRQNYSSLLDEVSRKKRELVSVESERLTLLVEKANHVLEKVRSTADACLDSRFIAASADLGAEKVQRLPMSVSDFSSSAYISILQSYLEGNSLGQLGMLVNRFRKNVSTPDYMLGPLEVQVTTRQARNVSGKRSDSTSGPVVKPTVVQDLTNADGSSTVAASEHLITIYTILYNSGSLPFYHFITDPASFTRTVENMFYVSFLIKEGKVRMFYPEISTQSDVLYIAVVEDQEETPAAEACQAVLGLTEQIWRENIRKFDIKSAIIEL